jgi:hypothetical protein
VSDLGNAPKKAEMISAYVRYNSDLWLGQTGLDPNWPARVTCGSKFQDTKVVPRACLHYCPRNVVQTVAITRIFMTFETPRQHCGD